jgi:hypothetical protein
MSRWGMSQLGRGAVVLLFPLLWLAGPKVLLAVGMGVAVIGYVIGRVLVLRGAPGELALSEDVTPFGEGVMTAGALALGLRVAHDRALISVGWWPSVGLVAVVWLTHWLVLPRIGKGAAGTSGVGAAGAGFVAELGMLVALLTIAAQNLADVMAGPVWGTQIITSPWPAWLGLGFCAVPMLRLSIGIEPGGDAAVQRHRAAEAIVVMAVGVLLVGVTGAGLWPG